VAAAAILVALSPIEFIWIREIFMQGSAIAGGRDQDRNWESRILSAIGSIITDDRAKIAS
jgi:hypothetical protein